MGRGGVKVIKSRAAYSKLGNDQVYINVIPLMRKNSIVLTVQFSYSYVNISLLSALKIRLILLLVVPYCDKFKFNSLGI